MVIFLCKGEKQELVWKKVRVGPKTLFFSEDWEAPQLAPPYRLISPNTTKKLKLNSF